MTFRKVFAPTGGKAEIRKAENRNPLRRASRARFLFQLSAFSFLLSALAASAGSLTGSFVPLPSGTSVDLTLEGSDSGGDWAHWGLTSPTSYDHKNAITPLITDFSVLGTNAPQQVVNLGVDYSWTDGTP